MSSSREREDREVPAKVRTLVVARDNSCCRICGRFVEHPALHHIWFRSRGGREGQGLHVPANLVVVGWYGSHDCHLPLAHGPEAHLWRDLLTELVDDPDLAGVTALALRRWRRPLDV